MIENNRNIENINLFRYLLIFVILSSFTIFGSYSVEFLSGYKEVLIKSCLILTIPPLYTIFKFVKANKRIPNKSEKKKLIWCSILIVWLIAGAVVSFEIFYDNLTLREYFSNGVNDVDSSTVILVVSNIITFTLMSFIMFIFYNFFYGLIGKILIKKTYRI